MMEVTATPILSTYRWKYETVVPGFRKYALLHTLPAPLDGTYIMFENADAPPDGPVHIVSKHQIQGVVYDSAIDDGPLMVFPIYICTWSKVADVEEDT